MFGGYASGNYLNSVERFDQREGNGSVLVKAMKEGRTRASAAGHNGLIYVTGGYAFGRGNGLDTVEMLVVFLLILPINFRVIFFCFTLTFVIYAHYIIELNVKRKFFFNQEEFIQLTSMQSSKNFQRKFFSPFQFNIR